MRSDDSESHIEVVFGGIEHGIPRIAMRDFLANVDATGKVSINGRGCFDCQGFMLLGQKEALINRLNQQFIGRDALTGSRCNPDRN